MAATLSNEKLAELIALQWRLSSLADDIKAIVDDELGEITTQASESTGVPLEALAQSAAALVAD